MKCIATDPKAVLRFHRERKHNFTFIHILSFFFFAFLQTICRSILIKISVGRCEDLLAAFRPWGILHLLWLLPGSRPGQ